MIKQHSYNLTGFMLRANMAIKKNIDTELRNIVLKRFCKLLKNFDEYAQEIAMNQWSSEFKISRKLLNAYALDLDTTELTPQEQAEEFLATFTIMQNEISKALSITKNGEKYTKSELYYILETQGYRTKHLNKLLDMENEHIRVVTPYNPLKTFFEELAKNYNGEPIIHQLCKCIPAKQHPDKPDGYYQQRLEKSIHKWLCKAAGQALHIGVNDVMLLFLDGIGGAGKTYLIDWLFSLPEIENYLITIREKESFMDIKEISRSKFAVNFDELPLTINGYNKLKSNITGKNGSDYNKKTGTYQSYKRMVNYIASSNKTNNGKQPGYLLDDDDAYKRRILPVEIDGRIDYNYYLNHIDLKQLWGQAANDILKAQENNNLELLTWECDYAELRYHNKRYVNTKDSTNNLNVILEMYPKGDKNDPIMQPQEILDELITKGLKLNLTDVQIGLFLTEMKYIKGRNHKKRGYHIKI